MSGHPEEQLSVSNNRKEEIDLMGNAAMEANGVHR
jgi:hypothetical protein